jgi:hypothetical protein
MEEQKKIPKWFLWITILGIIAIIVLFAWILFFLYSNIEAINLMGGNACAVCQSQTKQMINSSLILP